VDADLAAWAASGAMALTGRPGAAPLGPPAPLVPAARAWGGALPGPVDVLALLAERAAIAGLARGGDRSCGGATRLVRARDAWIAVTLARDDDVDAVPAWLSLDGPAPDAWDAIATEAPARRSAELEERAVLLGLPMAVLPATRLTEPASAFHGLPVVATRFGTARRDRGGPLRVLDLSSLWAGPLCGRLLGAAGADVAKVESTGRPDGARGGPPAFFDQLNAGKASVALDFRSSDGPRRLRDLVVSADVVIEASRPRALAQLGVDAGAVLAANDGPAVWVSITGHGRAGDAGGRVAFGDDAAVAGGLVVWDDDGPCFCADAVADPLSGVVAAAAALAAITDGGRWLLDVSMAAVAAAAAGPTRRVPSGLVAWPPSVPPPSRPAATLGRDTDAVFDRWVRGSRRAP
jgi:hypothetical protein